MNPQFPLEGYDAQVPARRPNRIRELREAAALLYPVAFSVGEFARRVGVSERTVRYWEEEGVIPGARIARMVAKEFRLGVDDLWREP